MIKRCRVLWDLIQSVFSLFSHWALFHHKCVNLSITGVISTTYFDQNVLFCAVWTIKKTTVDVKSPSFLSPIYDRWYRRHLLLNTDVEHTFSVSSLPWSRRTERRFEHSQPGCVRHVIWRWIGEVICFLLPIQQKLQFSPSSAWRQQSFIEAYLSEHDVIVKSDFGWRLCNYRCIFCWS